LLSYPENKKYDDSLLLCNLSYPLNAIAFEDQPAYEGKAPSLPLPRFFMRRFRMPGTAATAQESGDRAGP
jgi:hypothetical protein